MGSGYQAIRRAGANLWRDYVSSLIAMLLAVPVSFGIAVFLTQIAPGWLRAPVAAAVELLAGIPSIIYGMWGLFVFVPVMSDYVEPALNDYLGPLPIIGALFSGPPLGIGMLTAGIILGIIMILPSFLLSCATCSLQFQRHSRNRPSRSGARPGKSFATWCCPIRAAPSSAGSCSRAWSRPGRDHGRNIPSSAMRTI